MAEREHDDCCWCGDRRRKEKQEEEELGGVLRHWKKAYLVSLSSPGRVQREGENTALTYKGKCTAVLACFLSDARHITTGVKKIGFVFWGGISLYLLSSDKTPRHMFFWKGFILF